MTAEIVYLRTAGGRIHKAVLLDDRPLVGESCNLDDAPGTEEVLAAIPEETEPESFCGHCFGEDES